MELDKRDQFLLHLYDQLWSTIERTETGVWQFIGFTAAMFGIVALVFTESLPEILAGMFSMIIAFWGINVNINSGWWFFHNLMFARNIERQFLSPEDYGRLLPSKYKERRPRLLNTLNMVHIIAFLTIAIGVLFFIWSYITLAFFVAGIILSYYHYLSSRKTITDFINQTNPDA